MNDTPLLKKYRNWIHGNPQAFVLFEKMANQIKDAGFNRYSAWTLVNAIRWHTDLAQTEKYKISNDYIACLARDLIEKDNTFEGFFQLKKTKRI